MGNWFEKAKVTLRQATIEIFRESTDIVIASMTKDHVTSSGRVLPTALDQHADLTRLISDLQKSTRSNVCCIRPNSKARGGNFDAKLVH